MAKGVDELGILLTSHPKQQSWWEQGIASWRWCPHFILMGYDHVEKDHVPWERFMPPVDEVFVTGAEPGTLGHFRGELRQLQMGGRILAEKGKKFIYKNAADTGTYRWRHLPKLVGLLRRHHMIICGSTHILARLSTFNDVMEHWHDNMKCGGAELYLYSQIRRLGLNVRFERAPWWTEHLGYIHLQGEYAANNGVDIYWTWRRGQVWGDDYDHRDLIPGRGE